MPTVQEMQTDPDPKVMKMTEEVMPQNEVQNGNEHHNPKLIQYNSSTNGIDIEPDWIKIMLSACRDIIYCITLHFKGYIVSYILTRTK